MATGLDWTLRVIFENVCVYVQVEEVVGVLYEYIKMLRKIDPQEWVFKELQDMTNMEFRFVEDDHADEYAVNLSSKSWFGVVPDMIQKVSWFDFWLTISQQTCTCIRNIM